jgi:hypothetical protein
MYTGTKHSVFVWLYAVTAHTWSMDVDQCYGTFDILVFVLGSVVLLMWSAYNLIPEIIKTEIQETEQLHNI